MLLTPAIFVQIIVSILCTILVLIASCFGLQVIRGFDIQSGNEKQIRLEQKTYLISTLAVFCFVAGMLNFLFFIQTCEAISPQFVGAMCATGVLNANPYGWPALILKIFCFFGSALWLTLNYADNMGKDYPLIRIKYGVLLCMAPLAVFESVNLWLFFSGLEPDLIVSCCGSMFSVSAQGVAAQLSGIAPKSALKSLYLSGLLLAGAWGYRHMSRKGTLLFSLSAVAAFVISLVSMISLIGLYIYEHPHHHCPFCMLKSGYNFVGYLLYIPMFLATAAAVSAGALTWCSRYQSIKNTAILLENRLINISFGLFACFYVLTFAAVMRSNLTMAFWYA